MLSLIICLHEDFLYLKKKKLVATNRLRLKEDFKPLLHFTKKLLNLAYFLFFGLGS